MLKCIYTQTCTREEGEGGGCSDSMASFNLPQTPYLFKLFYSLEWSILISRREHFITSDLQFGFKSGFSTILCTDILKTVVNHYLNKDSEKNYACFTDPSNSFDTVEHSILFQKYILNRRMLKPIVQLLLHWCKTQKL